ncbi:hypothetical protein FRC10_009308, partial [Ceratobasidium sp. 414]
MVKRVTEIHGTNVYLKCTRCNQRPVQPASHFDKQLLRDGTCACPNCKTQSK